MIMPTKHRKLSNSLLFTGTTLLNYMSEPKTVTFLWETTRSLPEIKTFDRFTMALDFLFVLGVIDLKDGLVGRKA